MELETMKNIIFILYFFLLLTLPASSQFYKESQCIDLKKNLSKLKGEERIKTLINISECYLQVKLDSSLHYAQIAYKESKTINLSVSKK